MLKLYRATDRGTEYWEAWATGSEIAIHWGKLGEEGKNRKIPIKPGINPNDMIKSEAKPIEPQGSSR